MLALHPLRLQLCFTSSLCSLPRQHSFLMRLRPECLAWWTKVNDRYYELNMAVTGTTSLKSIILTMTLPASAVHKIFRVATSTSIHQDFRFLLNPSHTLMFPSHPLMKPCCSNLGDVCFWRSLASWANPNCASWRITWVTSSLSRCNQTWWIIWRCLTPTQGVPRTVVGRIFWCPEIWRTRTDLDRT